MSVIHVSDAAVAVARTRTIGLNLVHPLRTPITSQAPTAANLNATTEVMLRQRVHDIVGSKVVPWIAFPFFRDFDT